MPSVDTSWIDSAFSPPALNRSVRDAIDKDPKYLPLFKQIGSYVQTLKREGTPPPNEPTAKKRRLDAPTESFPITTSSTPKKPTADGAVLTVEGISFGVPMRKKFNLVITLKGLSAVTAAGSVEFGVEFDNVDYICCLPVPDKAARQWNYCIFPVGGDGLANGSAADAIVFTIPDGAPKSASGDAMGSGYDTTSYLSLLADLFNALLKPSKARVSSIEVPNEQIFHSALPQSHRKGEKAFHVKAHRGSKEGYLFFLQRGILWAFKKPLLYFSFSNIDSISYTSITTRTFNLSIRVQEDRGGAEHEFGMIDQGDYAGIDAYIKSRKLNDASMAEQRRAKTFNVNGKTDGDDAAVPGELEKALEDAEDEEEEDYVPGKGDDGSSGSESESAEDSDGSGDEEMANSDGEESIDLEDELGSELEDVEPDAPKPNRSKAKKNSLGS